MSSLTAILSASSAKRAFPKLTPIAMSITFIAQANAMDTM